MSRRKKRKKRSSEQKTSKKGTGLFNAAFRGLDSLKKDIHQDDEVKEKKESQRKLPPPAPDENRYFLKAMSDVNPLAENKSRVTRSPNPELRPAHMAKNDELEVVAHLSDLVNGTAEMDFSFSDEYIEGSVQGFDRKLMAKLKKGRFPIQDYIDLHGLTKDEAENKIRDFLLHSYSLGLRCVLVVHGRGLNSESNIPILKERLPIWLKRGPAKKILLAFSTAMPYDGGTGAIYILLRKQRIRGI